MRNFLKQHSAVFKHSSKVLIWVLFILVALEGLLQLGAVLIKENSWRAQSRWLTGHVRVLALGDSNTYGLYLPPEDAYPAQLQQQWNAEHNALPIEIINLGYPGTNTFRLLANLPELLDTFKPDLVLLMIGFNDVWTPAETPANAQRLSWLEKIQYHSRLYKLSYMVFQNFYVAQSATEPEIDMGERMLGGLSGPPLSEAEKKFLAQESGLTVAQIDALPNTESINPAVKTKFEQALQKIQEQRKQAAPAADILNTIKVGDKTFSLGIQRGEPARNSKQMEQNISAMLIQLNERNIPYILMNYPSNHGYYPAANRKIEKVATQTKSPYIDLSSAFDQECRNNPKTCPEYFFYDGHATAKGNALISVTVAKGLEDFFYSNKP